MFTIQCELWGAFCEWKVNLYCSLNPMWASWYRMLCTSLALCEGIHSWLVDSLTKNNNEFWYFLGLCHIPVMVYAMSCYVLDWGVTGPLFNSSWLNVTICDIGLVRNTCLICSSSWSSLAQVMACCLMAPSHYLNQCWLLINKVLWYSPGSNFRVSA